MFRPDAINIIKNSVTITQIVEAYGHKINRQGFILCPFHHEQTPSMKIYTATNTYKCFGGCGSFGTVIDFVKQCEQQDTHQAMETIAHRFGLDIWIPGTADEKTRAEAEKIRRKRDMELARKKEIDELVAARKKELDKFVEDIKSEILSNRKQLQSETEQLNKIPAEKATDALFFMLAQNYHRTVWTEYLFDVVFEMPEQIADESIYRAVYGLNRRLILNKLYRKEITVTDNPF